MKKLFFIAAVFFFAIFCFGQDPVLAAGTIYYVSPTGNDSNNGLSTALPFGTFSKATSMLVAGDHLRILNGTYTEQLLITNKIGTSSNPIKIYGYPASVNIATFPLLDGGDADFSSGVNAPAISIQGSSWVEVSQLKIINSSDASVYLTASHYIHIRRLNISFNKYGVRYAGKSSHLLVEHCSFTQMYPLGATWTDLKSSKWEGGAIMTSSGAGMNEFRFNVFKRMFNAIYLTKSASYVSTAANANIWIHDNYFEDIVDDSFEPEGYNVNNHFYRNVLKNVHRMVSLAPPSTLDGPIYIYNNVQINITDPTGEAVTLDRKNSAIKLDLGTSSITNGAYIFNNTVYGIGADTNFYGIDFLSVSVENITHVNNIYETELNAFSSSNPILTNSLFSNDLSVGASGYSEGTGWQNTSVGFLNKATGDLRLLPTAFAKAKSRAVNGLVGFADLTVIPASSDLGAFPQGSYTLRSISSPSYILPSDGEDFSFPVNGAWLTDTAPGYSPALEYLPKPTAVLQNVYFTFGKLLYGKYASPTTLKSGDTIYLKNYDPKRIQLLAISLYDYTIKGNQCYTRTWKTSTSMTMRTCSLLPAGRKYAFIFTFREITSGIIIKKYFVVNTISPSTITL